MSRSAGFATHRSTVDATDREQSTERKLTDPRTMPNYCGLPLLSKTTRLKYVQA